MNKQNTSLLLSLIIIVVIGLVGYYIYDAFSDKCEVSSSSETMNIHVCRSGTYYANK